MLSPTLETCVRSILVACLFMLMYGMANAAEYSSSDDVIWSGPYVGVEVGASHNHGRSTNSLNNWYNFTSSTPMTRAGTGLLGGLEGGYNYQINSFVIGAEGDWSFTHANGSTSFPEYGGNINGVHSLSTLLDLATLRARFGYAMDKFMLFGTGGLAIGHVSSLAYDYAVNVYDNSSYRTGWTTGGGLEYALYQNWSIKAEGLYYDLGAIKNQHFVYFGASYGSYNDYESGVVARLGLNYSF